MKIIICGFSGAGKSTLLLKLKTLSGNQGPFFWEDLDQLIYPGGPLMEFIQEVGEEKFRQKEEIVLTNFLTKSESSGVLALGGGALNERTLQFIKARSNCRLVFLDTPFLVCAKRIQSDASRLLNRLSLEELKKLYEKRRKLYKEAHLVLSNLDEDQDGQLEELVNLLLEK